MTSFIKTVQANIVAQAVLFIILGLVLLLMPDITLVTIVYFVGILFALSGIVSLIGYFREGGEHYRMQPVLATGISFLVLAAVMFIFPQVIAGAFSVALGLILLLCGIVNVVRSIDMKNFEGNQWIVYLLLSVAVVIGGIIIIWNPFETTAAFVMVLGAFLIVNGISDLLIELKFRKGLKAERS